MAMAKDCQPPSYTLSRELRGHSEDVRVIDICKNGSIVSGGRDRNTILWKNQDGSYYTSTVMTGHSNFVSSVCIIDPTEKHPQGLIVTGSNDSHICIYTVGEPQPLHKFHGHENTVCCLKASIFDKNSFLSSSWDISAKLWDLNDLTKPQVTFVGHSAAVWCVADIPNGVVVTGSADKTVIMYSRKGDILRKIKAHSDCVRDIAVLNEGAFLTCANDAIIKHWCASTGDCLTEFYGHTNYIYSLAAINSGSLAASCGEDKTVRVWWNGDLCQTITVPTETVWCVKILPNKDIVCGSSDGYIRIFTTDEKRYADPEVIKNYENAIVEKNGAQALVGDLDVTKLPDVSEALLQPGKKNGEIKVMSDKGIPKAYMWDQVKMKWDLVGDVMGSKNETSKRQMHNGVEYDYVFSIDISDGVPPLKLPYNQDQDPWHVAQNFIDKNDLPQSYLEEIANFIIKNTANAQQQNTPVVPQFYDPFTGGSRYIPAPSAESAKQPPVTSPPTPSNSNTFKFIPMLDYLKLEQANLAAIHEKLKEFNLKMAATTDKIPEERLEWVVKLATKEHEEAVQAGAIDTLMSLLNWPDSMIFPVLDITRLAVLHKTVNDKVCTDELMKSIEKHLTSSAAAANRMLAYRLLSNMFCHAKGEKCCLDNMQSHITLVKQQFPSRQPTPGNKNNQVALSTYILNLAVAMNKTSGKQRKGNVLDLISTILEHFSETEAIFRVLVGLGTLLMDPDEAVKSNLLSTLHQSEGLLRILKTALESPDVQNKLTIVSKEVSRLI
ncbi:phospholipase A-2-activating protein [Copidosoma floridanum]|uniref:phospholipase A-2-activating protein n=1 Tax=Copidosoma floridanum TaxID=29053 RepID=UPI0006C9D615|nr:phospholipase A-2-activating protein [Copidosoma floridanum]